MSFERRSCLVSAHYQIEAEKAAPDLAVVQRRMKDIVGVLENFASRRAEGMSRGDYLQQV